MQPTIDRSRGPGRRGALRYAPFVAIPIVIALVAVFLSGGDDEERSTSTSTSDVSGLPVTFRQAQEQGLDIDFGPSCDPATGRVRVPSVYAASCVEPWKGGDNGGATSPGVTADEITVVVYLNDPALDPLQTAFYRDAGANVDPEANRKAFENYLRLFEDHYEFYGRKYRIESYLGTGAPSDEVAAKADAIEIADRFHPFAVINGPTQSSAFADELAARKILCLGICSLAFPESFTRQRLPYLWSIGPTPDQSNAHAAEMIGTQLAGRKASFAGDPAFQDQERVFGFVWYDNPDGRYKPGHEKLLDTLRDDYGVDAAADVPFFLDLARVGEIARTAIAQLKDAGVTTVVFSGDPIMPASLTKEATAQEYFPEWVVSSSVLADTAIFGRTYDQEQWQHAIALSLVPGRGTTETQDGYFLHRWQYCEDPPSQNFQVLFPGPQTLSSGIQLAGPNLTPDTFQAALYRAPASGGGPTRPTVSRGKHGIWPGTDLGGLDDATLTWWDPDARGADETGHDGRGLWRYTSMGKRYLPGHWPRERIPLFDTTDTVTIFDELPPGDRAPDYPSPCAA
jgi:hypothetical protein